MPFKPITPVDCTPGTAGSFQDVDIDSYIADLGNDVKGVQLMLINTYPSGELSAAVRKNGSTDNRYYGIRRSGQSHVSIGVDASKIFEAKIGNITYLKLYIVGYYSGDEFAFFDNGYDKSTSTTSAWTDVDCSSQASGAIGLFFTHENSASYLRYFGMRKNGSTDARTGEVNSHYCYGVIIGCDGSQICEQRIYNTDTDIYLVGYCTENAVFNTNATDRSLGSSGSYQDLAALPSGAVAGIYETEGTAEYDFSLRKNGTSLDYYYSSYEKLWAVVECDESQLVEGKIESTGLDFFEIGYFSSGSTPSNNILAAVGHYKQQGVM